MGAPRPLPPALKGVIECLAVTPYDWYLREDGKLRARENGTEMCVLTGVARYRTGRTYSTGDWIHAGESLGLSPTAAGLIVEASDRRSPTRRIQRLRHHLLAAALHTPRPRRATIDTYEVERDASSPCRPGRSGAFPSAISAATR